MPGSDVVHKQSVLGGIAGIAILAFALIYRFYPGLPSGLRPSSQPGATAVSGGSVLTMRAPAGAPRAEPAGFAATGAPARGTPTHLAPPRPPPAHATTAPHHKNQPPPEEGRP